MDPALPRRAVIDRAWRALGPGVEVFSGADGGPLRRTVKRIIDPLVLRLRSNTHFSAPVLTPAVAAELHEQLIGCGLQLRAAAAWFVELKQQRRQLRITTGNAQELYFPVCFELAVTRGAPGADKAQVAAQVLAELHRGRDRTAIEVLNDHVADPRILDRLHRQCERSWNDVLGSGSDVASGTDSAAFFAGLATVLGPADSHRAAVARQRVWSALVADATPHNLGAAARRPHARLPFSIVDTGLSSALPQRPPPIDGPAEGDRPLDRSVADRVRATLRRALDRDELPGVPLLCAEEVDRACAPWGLLAEDKQAGLLAGIEVATDLHPLDASRTGRHQLSARIQARLAKEAYVLHARRYLAAGAAVHPRQRQVIDDLGAFCRPYLNRLWARLHGRDVWQESCADVDELRSLLEGVARSVSLDHRQRIKTMLEVRVAG
ncbi:hypothetical protein FR943_16320 [Mycobacterium sp. TNTM28]|uniref:Uncharacterized protein n=1 Tax=[Mycobacterium] fortunisiensis TaxID=2600579 RepID=A0ABS6KPD3_9MYCO|nr:hypothetical protein [[Mycobacterium] fortunisiensis]MBU9765406.1 hypothetical protein [[Mycobacterium] fortunisiensis]